MNPIMNGPIMITLNQIREHRPCEPGWEKLLKSKGKTQADDEPFPLTDVLDSNGVSDALWCLRCLPQRYQTKTRRLARSFAVDVAHLWDVPDVVRTFLLTGRQRLAARDVARAAAASHAAAWDAWDAWAAWDAAWAAVYAERDAAWDAWGAARVAWDAAGAKQAARFRDFCERDGDFVFPEWPTKGDRA